MTSRPVPVPLPTTTAPGRDGYIGGHRLVNCMSSKRPAKGKTATQVWAIAGLKSFCTIAVSHPIRGMIEVDETGYVVVGPLLYSVSASGTATLRGAVPGSGRVQMARNRRQPAPEIVIVSDGLVYLWNGTTVATLSDTDLPPPNGVVVIDGYAVYTIADGRILASQIDDAGNIDPLSVAREDTSPDANVGIARRGRDVVVFGATSVGFWHDVGGDPFPLEPVSAIDGVGCLSGASIVSADQTLFWVASDNTVRRLEGYSAQIVSTPDIAEAIAATTDRANIEALSWVDRGNTLVEFSCDDWTYVLNLATGAWHEQRSYGKDRWRASSYMKLGGKDIVGDFEQAKLYELDANTYTDAGSALVTEIHTTLDSFDGGVTVDRIEIDTIAGVGLNTTVESNAAPEIMVAASGDNGRTWGVERRAQLGRIGQYGQLAYVHQLGSFWNGVRVRLSCSAAVRRGIVGLTAEVEGLAS